ncbi:Class II Aldolase and Adducin N-terminal domain-containing protein [Flexibacter flexilis DSM 6793]|uniref:Class II Aldolase and Adducin N-terminal domain-containing protein n=1 Tax=Flexibacter flexilis DSM 6793 TaxID=927664 RepID=A0A1I1H057_9BACT|nr:class II aldolase/adducin family protein [Flexibacter flexilis]SFC17437.1 Class II Aldolase and Adducin N-terminal domain-containing protein [Flexibacter flexilis DSM 6793]
MSTNTFQSFLAASRLLGSKSDLVQGGGGNTSFKINEELMAIKASGFLLSEMTESQAYTMVNYKPVIQLFNDSINENPTKEQEDITSKFVGECVDKSGNYPVLRPSMETGFHAVLEKVVYHTHSVYSNLVNCAQDCESLLSQIFENTAIRPIYIPYANPGFGLSQSILKAKNDFIEKNGCVPSVFFLQNHGLVTTGDEVASTLALDEQVNDILKKYFDINLPYPRPAVTHKENKLFESQNAELAQWLSALHVSDAAFFEQVLFPDQVVFFSGNIAIRSAPNPDKKINIHSENFGVTYLVETLKEAITLEETLLAYLFLRSHISAPNFIGQTQANYINNMESEAYRRALLKK